MITRLRVGRLAETSGVFAFLLFLALIGLWKTVESHAYPGGQDFRLHLFRVMALDSALASGDLYPRWFEGFAFGFGYPILHYYAPLTYYVAELFHALGARLADSLLLVAFVARLLGAIGTYALCRRLLGSSTPALTGPAVFLLSSYQFTDLYERSAVPELLALNLVPVALWAVAWAAPDTNTRSVGVAALSIGLLALAHQTTFATSAALIAAFAVWQVIDGAGTSPSHAPWRRLGWITGAGLLGLALSAFYWLPALADRGLVRMEEPLPGADKLYQALPALPDVFQISFFYQHAHPYFTRVPLLEAIILAAALLALPVLPRRARSAAGFFGLTAIAAVLMMTSATTAIWDNLPALALMQFPWRLRLYVTVSLAVLCASLAASRPRSVGLTVGIAAPLLFAISTLGDFGPPLVKIRPDAVTEAAFARFELNRQHPAIGTTFPTQFLPRTVGADAASLPTTRPDGGNDLDADAAITVVQWSAERLAARVSSANGTVIRPRVFWFPDWRATIDGAPASTAADGSRGLLSVAVPAGEHEVVMTRVAGPATVVATGISGAALALLAGLIVWRRNGFRRSAGAATGALLAFGAIAAWTAVRPAISWSPPPPNAGFGDVDLVGWKASADAGVLRLELAWLARRAPVDDVVVDVTVVDLKGEVAAESHRRPRWGAADTTTWAAGDLVHDIQELPLPASAVSAEWAVRIGLSRPGSEESPRTVGHVRLGPASAQGATAIAAAATDLSDGIAIVVDEAPRILPPPELRPGDVIVVHPGLLARAEAPVDATLSVFLVDSAGAKYGIQEGYPPHDLEFTGAWRRGTLVRQPYSVRLEKPLPPGAYQLAVEALDYQTKRRLSLAGKLSAPQRFILGRYKVRQPEPPEPTQPCQATYGGVASLDGYDVDLRSDGGRHHIRLALYWRAVRAPLADFTVFVHAVDGGGAMLAQHDGQPQDGTYPTSIWSAGESIVDQHDLFAVDLPPDAKLRVGLYLPSTGQRLEADGGGDFLELTIPR